MKTFPAVLVYGPRQCGKSTLVRRTLPGWRHLDLERPITQSRQRLVRPEAFFWRTHAGAEVDLLLQDGTKILPFEIKLSSTVGGRELTGLRQCMEDLNIKRGAVIYTGREHRSVGHGIELLPWKQVQRGEWVFNLNSFHIRVRAFDLSRFPLVGYGKCVITPKRWSFIAAVHRKAIFLLSPRLRGPCHDAQDSKEDLILLAQGQKELRPPEYGHFWPIESPTAETLGPVAPRPSQPPTRGEICTLSSRKKRESGFEPKSDSRGVRRRVPRFRGTQGLAMSKHKEAESLFGSIAPPYVLLLLR